MALNGLFCADVPLRNYSLTVTAGISGIFKGEKTIIQHNIRFFVFLKVGKFASFIEHLGLNATRLFSDSAGEAPSLTSNTKTLSLDPSEGSGQPPPR